LLNKSIASFRFGDTYGSAGIFKEFGRHLLIEQVVFRQRICAPLIDASMAGGTSAPFLVSAGKTTRSCRAAR